MHVLISGLSILFLLSGAVRTGPVPLSLEKRDKVDDCGLVLVALKASSFCSSFAHIMDVTQTVMLTAPAQKATATVPAALCTVTALAKTTTTTVITSASKPILSRIVTLGTPPLTTTTLTLAAPTISTTVTGSSLTTTETTTETSTSAETSTVTVTLANALAKQRRHAETAAGDNILARGVTTTTKASSTTPVSCALKGLPSKLAPFACDVVSLACSKFLHPSTTAVTKTQPGSTSTITATASPKCTTLIPADLTVTLTSTSTLPAQTVTQLITPPLQTVTQTLTPQAMTETSTITPPVLTLTVTTTITTTTTTTTTVTASPPPLCSNGDVGQTGETQGNGSNEFTYYTFCNTYCRPVDDFNFLGATTSPDFQSCIDSCDQTDVIVFANYEEATGVCKCFANDLLFINQPGYDCAINRDNPYGYA